MDSTLATTSSLNLNQIRFGTLVLSLILSLLAFHADGIMNRDGIMYMNMAQAFVDGGLQAMAKIYDWPFYSMLIGGLHSLTGLSLETAGRLISIVFFVAFTDILVLLSARLLPNSTQIAFAAILILGFITLNSYRAFIIRDIGYWAAIMWSLYLMMLFVSKPSWKLGALWQVTTLLALLFRVEAVAILSLLPLVVFLYFPVKQALIQLVKLYSVLVVLSIAAAAVLFTQDTITGAFNKLGNALYYLNLTNTFALIERKANLLAQHVFYTKFVEDEKLFLLICSVLGVIIYRSLKGLTLSYIGIYLYAKFSHTTTIYHPDKGTTLSYRPIVIGFALINFVILLAFVFKSYFLSTRYTVTFVTTLFLLMLPLICFKLEQLLTEKRKLALFIIGFIVFAGIVDTSTTSVKKDYIKTTAHWASQQIPAGASVLTDDEFLDFYYRTHQPKTTLTYTPNNLSQTNQHQYLVVLRHHDDAPLVIEGLTLKPVFESANSRGDKGVVYLVNPVE